jgi:hypothetical protein
MRKPDRSCGAVDLANGGIPRSVNSQAHAETEKSPREISGFATGAILEVETSLALGESPGLVGCV